MTQQWPRDAFTREVWGSSLKPNQRLVALAYADHARDQEFAFLTMLRGKATTGLSQASLRRAIRELEKAGWLEVKELGGPKRATRYWLRIPAQQSQPETAEGSQAERSHSETAQYETAEVSHGDARGLTVTTDYSEDSSKELSSIDAREAAGAAAHVPEAHRPVVLELMARLGSEVTEQDVVDCVAWAFDSGKKNPGGYLSRFPAADVRARAADHRQASTRGDRCEHDELGGMRILGVGEMASRKCRDCETKRPAVFQPKPQSRTHEIDWEAAAARAAARDAALTAKGGQVVPGQVVAAEEAS